MKQLRKLLFPFATLYYIGVWLRNFFYDKGFLSSKRYDFPVICVGNLSTGGTGKTPMTEFLIRALKDAVCVGVLSRGYGRKTTGYLQVQPSHTALEVGDEPLQYATKFSDIPVAVCEDRREGIKQLQELDPAPQIIVLDDAFQHRKVSASFSILLTAYSEPFYEDYVLPAGNLRDLRNQARRAQAIVVTKCPKNLTTKEQESIQNKIATYSVAPVYFATISYGDFVMDTQSKKVPLDSLKSENLTVVTGIANPAPLLQFLDSRGVSYEHRKYGDHHNFTEKQLLELEKCSCILTTEKDYMRLKSRLKNPTVFYIPIAIEFLSKGEEFRKKIKGFIQA